MENPSEISREGSAGAAGNDQELPLDVRIKAVRARLRAKIKVIKSKVDRTIELGVNLFGLGARVDCVNCGAIRVRPDPTGLTCGSQWCLAALSRIFDDLEKPVKESEEEKQFRELIVPIVEKLGLKPSADDSIYDIAESIDEAVKEISTQSKNLAEIIVSIAEKLGLKPGADEDILVFTDRIDIAVEELQAAVGQLEDEIADAEHD